MEGLFTRYFLECNRKQMVACLAMSEEAKPPRLVVPIAVTVCAGVLACITAFVIHKFELLFLSAGSLWVLFLFYLYRLWWPGIPFVPFQRKAFRGYAVLGFLLIFTATWYIIIWLDPSLRPPP
jgi:hypothetical protein